MNLPIAVIADDVELNRAILNEVLRKEYLVLEAADGRETLKIVEKYRERVAILLLDIVMPVLDGFQVLEAINRLDLEDRIPVIMISAENTEDLILRCYELGAADFISRPFSPNIVLRRVNNIVELYRHKGRIEKLAASQNRKLRQMNDFMVNTLSNIVEFRSGESSMHVRRIRYITEQLLKALSFRYKEYGLTAAGIEEISTAAALHDIGKIAVPEQILNKPGPLTPEEFAIVKTHPLKGAQLLENIHRHQDWTYYRYCYDICRYHHERWDGGGYPDGLKGNEIPLSAQVVSLADVYDALTSRRVYKPAFSHQKAIAMIRNGDCGAFNPRLLECLMEIEKDLAQSVKTLNGERPEFLEGGPPDPPAGEEQKDISSRTLALLEQERIKYQALASLSDEVLFDYDYASDTLSFSEKYGAVFHGDLIVRNARSKVKSLEIFGRNGDEVLLGLNKSLSPKNPVHRTRLQIETIQKELRWFEVTVKSLWSADPIPRYLGCLGKLADVNKEMHEKHLLKEKADKDFLTGLYNRNAFQRLVTERLREERKGIGALFFADLDDFKQINDSRGHIFGDEVLKYTAVKMKGLFRSTDIVGRIGGDEFVVFLNNLQSEEDGAGKARKLCRLLGRGYPLDKTIVPLSVSVGIAFCPKDGDDCEALLLKADRALYQAKADGKGRCIVYRG